MASVGLLVGANEHVVEDRLAARRSGTLGFCFGVCRRHASLAQCSDGVVAVGLCASICNCFRPSSDASGLRTLVRFCSSRALFRWFAPVVSPFASHPPCRRPCHSLSSLLFLDSLWLRGLVCTS
ncbi:unnamed protein product, partial [Phaeothamnion confervicola]